MFQEIKNTGVKISEDMDIKKAYELIKKNIHNKNT